MGKLSDITSGKRSEPYRMILYGQEGIGKSTFAADAPNPVFIQAEDGLGQIDTAKFPLSKSYGDVLECITELGTTEHEFKTVVIDSIDWLEPLVFKSVCEEYGVDTIHKAAGGFNRGFDRAVNKWQEICSALDWLRSTKGMNVIMVAHAKIKSVNDPENPAYDKFFLKLHDKANEWLTEWADCVLFATKKMIVTKDESGKNKAQAIGRGGGDRIIRTVASPACTAKNRFNLPDELPLVYGEFEKALANNK